MQTIQGTIYLNPHKEKGQNAPEPKPIPASAQDIQKTETLKKQANTFLFTTKTVWPFKMFPSTLVIDRYKVEIRVGRFFMTNNYHTMLIPNIHNVVLHQGVFLSGLEFEVTGYEQNPPKIHYLDTVGARRAKELIDALIIADKQRVNIEAMSYQEIVDFVRSTTSLRAVDTSG